MMCIVFFFKQKTAYEMLRSLVGSEMCIRDRVRTGMRLLSVGETSVREASYEQVLRLLRVAAQTPPVCLSFSRCLEEPPQAPVAVSRDRGYTRVHGLAEVEWWEEWEACVPSGRQRKASTPRRAEGHTGGS
eukprot:TRINITY_DN45347_c0_g1_i1.p3 TRINITY_DN45347_c0_g1~~TRINITY_DN45347_c0_g1_i1.p3  ORF type:complete len:131 (-),score=30.12 TRINITY_DN45347_c0_g1_i1:504-896(-)